jgi:hypothetical protein
VHFIPGWDCHGLPIEAKALAAQQQEEASVRQQGVDLSDADGTEAWRFGQEEENDGSVQDDIADLDEVGEDLLEGLEGGGLVAEPLHAHAAVNSTDELTAPRRGELTGTLDDTAAHGDVNASTTAAADAGAAAEVAEEDEEEQEAEGSGDDDEFDDDGDIEFGSNDELSF